MVHIQFRIICFYHKTTAQAVKTGVGCVAQKIAWFDLIDLQWRLGGLVGEFENCQQP